MKRFFIANKAKVAAVIVVFLATAVFGLIQSADAAELTKSETRLGLGVGIIHAELGGSMTASWSEIFNEKWAIDMFFVGEQSFAQQRRLGLPDMRNNFGLGVSRRIPVFEKYELVFGTFFWQNENFVLGCKMTAHLGVSRKIGKKWRFAYDHFSNGGSCSPNAGQDSLQFQRGIKFGG